MVLIGCSSLNNPTVIPAVSLLFLIAWVMCRCRGREGPDVRDGPPREFGAVELALRNSSTRGTKYILEPVIGTSFDSLAEAYEFYNLYSWEVGFGIRYGKSYTNGKHYRSSQELICQLQVNTYRFH
jgi:hypothetical protein